MDDAVSTEKKGNVKGTVIQILFLILLLISICALISAVITIYKYKDMLAQPLQYNMDRFNISVCTCTDSLERTSTIYALSYNGNRTLPVTKFIDTTPKIDWEEVNKKT